MKKQIVLFSALLSTTTLFAAQHHSSDHDAFVTIPQLSPQFSLSYSQLWLRPGASNLNYAIYNNSAPDNQALRPYWNEQELKPQFSPAFELGADYAFSHASGKDVYLDWQHLDSETVNAAVSAAGVTSFVGPDYAIGPDSRDVTNATGAAQFKADVIHLDFGQSINFGQHFRLRILGGLNTAFLTENLTDVYSGVYTSSSSGSAGPLPTGQALVPGPFSVSQYEKSLFSGAGPRLGLDANYRMHCGFGILGEGAVSALMGDVDSNTNYLGVSQSLINYGYAIPNHQHIADEEVFSVIPAFDGKLGVDYFHNFKNNMSLDFAIGYEASVYMNAISQYLPGTLVPGLGLDTGSIYVVSMNHVISNYSLQGPFLKLTAHF